MTNTESNITVEVIVWDGIKQPHNPFGHVTTKIIKNGFTYSYSLEKDDHPRIVCNTESFKKLEKHEQRMRAGNGFILNLTPDQAREIFMTMQTKFHAYQTNTCVYHFISHNCTHAIQLAIKKVGIDLYNFVPFGVTHYPSDVQRDLLMTKNNGAPLVKGIIQYPKGQDKGIPVKSDKVKLLFNTVAAHGSNGWHESSGSDLSENW